MAGNPGAVRAGGAYVELSVRSAALEKGLRKAQLQLQEFGAKAQSAGRSMVMLGAGVAVPFALATRKGMEFTDTMAIVGAVTQATAQDFQALTDKAKTLGATTSFTASQVAEGMVSLGRAGYDTVQIMAAIPDVLDLSRATATELGMAAEIAAAAMRGFNLTAEDTKRIADVLTTATNSSAQTLTDLGESMKYVAPIAVEAGATIEDTAAALALLANNGIKGSMAGTALARAYKNLATTGAQDTLAELNVRAVDANGNLRSMSAILSELGKATEQFGSAQRLNIFEELFGRGQAAALKLAAAGSVFDDIADKINNASNEASRLAKAMDDNLGGSFRLLQSATEGLQLDIFDAIKDDVRELTDGLTEAVGEMASFVRENGDAIKTTGKLTVALIGLGAAFYGVGTAAKAAAFGLGIFKTSVVGLRLFVGAAAKVITTLSTMVAGTKLFAMAMGLLTPAVEVATVAILKFVALPVGVALAGWYIGKAIDDWTGFSEWVEKTYRWLFNIKQLSQEQTELEMVKGWKKQLDEGAISLKEYEKRLRALAEVRANRGKPEKIDPGDTTENKGHPALGQVGDDAPAGGTESQGKAEAREKNLQRIREETARLMLEAQYDGIELQRQQLDLAEQQAIAAAEGEEEVIASIKEQYALKKALLNVEYDRTREQEKQREAEKKAREAAWKAEREQEEAARKAETAAQHERDVQKEIEDLKLQLAYDGLELEKEQLKLAEKRALVWAKMAGIDPALIEEEFDLREKLAEKRAKQGEQPEINIAQPSDVFGSFSARAVSGQVADKSVKELTKANTYLSQIATSTKKMTDSVGLA